MVIPLGRFAANMAPQVIKGTVKWNAVCIAVDVGLKACFGF
jgi:hypothetical protein